MEQPNNLQLSNVLKILSSKEQSTLPICSQETKPAYTKTYLQKYGSLQNVCQELSFSQLGKLAADTTSALTSDVPTFIRLNQTFGSLASQTWICSHLKNLLSHFLVDEKKISEEQIEFLANVIVNNYPSMKLTEFMLFESYFLQGKYKDFYGETSYILAITSSLQAFKKD